MNYFISNSDISIQIFILFVSSILLLFFISRYKNPLIMDEFSKSHAINKTLPRIGSVTFLLIILIEILFFFLNNSFSITNIFLFSYLFLMLGLAEDLLKNISPLIRFLIIVFLSLFSVIIFNISLNFDIYFLNNKIINISFIVLAFVVLMNGANFIDGLNGLLLFYSLLISLILLFLIRDEAYYANQQMLMYFVIIIISLILFNFPYAKIYVGDGGAYFIGYFLGYQSIQVYNNVSNISPFFIAVLLIYPVLEVFFSVLRRRIKKVGISVPDNYHMHHIIQNFIIHKYSFQNIETSNFLSSVIILSLISIYSMVALLFAHSHLINIFILLSIFVVYLFVNVYKRSSK